MEQVLALKRSDKGKVDEIEVTSRLINIIFEMPIDQQIELLEFLDSQGGNPGRRHERTSLKNPWIVMIDPEEEPSECFIKDISRCGMFIETTRKFQVGEKIVMKFQMPSSRKIFRIIGEIARCQENGIGVRFKRQIS